MVNHTELTGFFFGTISKGDTCKFIKGEMKKDRLFFPCEALVKLFEAQQIYFFQKMINYSINENCFPIDKEF